MLFIFFKDYIYMRRVVVSGFVRSKTRLFTILCLVGEHEARNPIIILREEVIYYSSSEIKIQSTFIESAGSRRIRRVIQTRRRVT